MKSQPIRLLLMEANRTDVKLLRRMFNRVEETEYQLHWAGLLSAGLKILSQENIDLVLLDLFLPDSKGLETLEKVLRAAPAIPILIVTKHENRSLGLAAVRKGAQDYLIIEYLNRYHLDRSIHLTLERFRAEQDLRHREAQLRVLADQLPALLWTTDGRLCFTFSRGASLIDLNLKPDEAVGTTLFDYFHTKDPNHPAIMAHHRALQGESVSYDLEWLGKVYHSHVEPLRFGTGGIAGTIGIALDVTDSRRIEEELGFARKIQERLLPRTLPSLEGFEIGASSYPAAAAGGDYFDFIPPHNGIFKIILGDVSGHGFGAALMMATTRAYLRALTRVSEHLQQTLELANQLLADDLIEDNFVTLFYCGLDLLNRSLIYSSAGHTTGYILDKNGDLKRQLYSTDLPIGVLPGQLFSCSEPIPLEAQDLVLLLTDGLLDAFAPDDTMFGKERVIATARVYRESSAQEIVYNLYHTARAFSHYYPQHDDISAVVIKVK